MAGYEKISAQQARVELSSNDALLVCGYDDERCTEFPVPGALPWPKFSQHIPELSRDQGIVLYCN